jgi:integrase
MPRRYQNGTLSLENNVSGPCWYLRFTNPGGSRPRIRIGLKTEYPTRAKASRAAQPHRDRFNASPADFAAPDHTFGDVLRRYELEEIPERFSTQRGYLKWHRLYIEPKWGSIPLLQVEAHEVRTWLKGLTKTDHRRQGEPLSSRSRGHIHGQMKNLFKHAMLWKWMPAQINPMSLFSLKGATKRSKKPRVISPAQFRALLEHFGSGDETSALRMQALLVGGYCLGLRASELFALRWEDFDHLGAVVAIRRAIVQGNVGDVKTERSDSPLPLAKFVGETFLRWRQQSLHREDEDWVFASPYRGGRKPMDPNSLQSKHLVAAGNALGLDFNLGWHTLRHSYKSLLDRVSSDASLKRDLMRHADVHTTMQVYGEVEMDRMREINDLAVLLATTE